MVCEQPSVKHSAAGEGSAHAVDRKLEGERSILSMAGLLLSSGPNKPEKQVNRNLIKFNKNKCKILYLEEKNTTNLHSLGDQRESSFPKKDL